MMVVVIIFRGADDGESFLQNDGDQEGPETVFESSENGILPPRLLGAPLRLLVPPHLIPIQLNILGRGNIR